MTIKLGKLGSNVYVHFTIVDKFSAYVDGIYDVSEFSLLVAI